MKKNKYTKDTTSFISSIKFENEFRKIILLFISLIRIQNIWG